MNAAACALMGYMMGTVNPAYILGKIKGMDIRTVGSGNAGASNAVLMLGKVFGFFCMIFDILKAFLAYRIAKKLYPALRFAGILAGVACILGHIFPVWMGFSGGKGLACIGGLILAYNWKLFSIMLVGEILFVLIVDYICLMALSVSAVFPLIYLLQTGDMIGTGLLLVVTAVMFYKHRENLQRIKDKKEVRVSFLWKRDEEIERLRDKYPEIDIEAYIAPDKHHK